jgi:hypothetical protein
MATAADRIKFRMYPQEDDEPGPLGLITLYIDDATSDEQVDQLAAYLAENFFPEDSVIGDQIDSRVDAIFVPRRLALAMVEWSKSPGLRDVPLFTYLRTVFPGGVTTPEEERGAVEAKTAAEHEEDKKEWPTCDACGAPYEHNKNHVTITAAGFNDPLCEGFDVERFLCMACGEKAFAAVGLKPDGTRA